MKTLINQALSQFMLRCAKRQSATRHALDESTPREAVLRRAAHAIRDQIGGFGLLQKRSSQAVS